MESELVVAALAALAHEGRLEVFRLLVRRAPDAVPAGEIAGALGLRATTLSNQLAQLEAVGLARSRRAGRSILYAANLERIGAVLGFLATDCCKGRPEACRPAAEPLLRRMEGREERTMPKDGVYNVLFLCTHNSARSIMAEAILNRIGQGRFKAYSAGSRPRTEIHPRTLDLLKTLNYDVGALRAKSWSEFSAPGAPELDFVFTVCDRAANEPCPVWPGQPMSAHWSVEDPSEATGSDSERGLAFMEAYRHLYNRLNAFSSLPIGSLDSLTLQKRLDDIGKMPAAEPAA